MQIKLQILLELLIFETHILGKEQNVLHTQIIASLQDPKSGCQ